MKKEIYYCDVCNKEIKCHELTKKTIPIINDKWATGGRGDVKLAYLGRALEFKDQDLCPLCLQKYNQVWTDGMAKVAQDWDEQVNAIKIDAKN